MIGGEVTTWTPNDAAARDLTKVRHVLPASAADIDRALVLEYAHGLDKRLGVTLGGAAIVDALGYLLDADALARLAEAQTTATVLVEVAGSRVLEVSGPGDPRSPALRVLAKAEAEAPVVVVSDTGMATAAFAWFPPHLVEVISHPQGRRGRLMRPAMGLGPVQNSSAATVSRWTGPLPEEVRALLDAVGLGHDFLR